MWFLPHVRFICRPLAKAGSSADLIGQSYLLKIDIEKLWKAMTARRMRIRDEPILHLERSSSGHRPVMPAGPSAICHTLEILLHVRRIRQ